MSDTDSFVEEVTEELRRDRMSALWRRWGPWIIGVLVAIVAAAAALSWLDHREQMAAREAGSRLITAAQAEDPLNRAAEFDSLAATEPEAGPALVARLSQAAALVEAGDVDAALAIFDAVAEDASVDDLYRSLAGFKAVTLRAADLPPLERAAAMERFAFQGEPFRLLALEQRAMAFHEAGDAASARREIETALAAQDMTPRLRDRLETMLRLVGGEGGNEG